jgi:sec-independent protein translocase protein TatB
MFNIGPMEFLVLALVAVIVLGPERLPQFAREAAQLLRTLRDLATGARSQLRDELGPEFADLDLSDLRNLNPRTALQRAILGDEESGLRGELRKYDPRDELRDLDPRRLTDEPPVSMRKPEQVPLRRDEPAPYDNDAT